MNNEIESSNPIKIENLSFFASPVFKISMPDYIDIVKEVSEEVFQETIKNVPELADVNEIYPTRQSGSFHNHQKLQEFSQDVIQLSWEVLNAQGYDMKNFTTMYEAMWLQEHHKMSGMEQHVHKGGIYLVGFYFLDVPKNSSRLIFYDPRPGKVQIDLPQADMRSVTLSSDTINIEPSPGDLFFSPSWLPHSFSRHGSDNVLKFVHINISVQNTPQMDQEEKIYNDEPIVI
jgi:hypothetical protein